MPATMELPATDQPAGARAGLPADLPSGRLPGLLPGEVLTQLTELPAFRGATVVDAERLSGACVRVHLSDGRRVVATIGVPSAANRSVAHESAVLARLHPLGLPVPRPIATLTGATTVLVTDDAPGFAPLDRRRAEAGGASPDWAAIVGRALAAVHTGVTPARLPRSDPGRHLLRAWTTGHPAGGGSAGFLQALHERDLLDPLQDAVDGWRPTSLVHGNVRTRTMLCGPSADGRRPLLVVDWARAGHGDARWDVGCLIGDYLAGWLTRASKDGDTDGATGGAAFAPVHAEIRAATSGYAALHRVTPADRRQWVRYAAFPLLHDAGRASVEGAPDRAAALLEVAAHLLRRPDACGELLLCP